jgi:glycosyltransferase involved in cell wall biosynthesis
MTMTISVVIATYNRADRLHQCLLQLERQPFMDGDEIVVADNGSNDGTNAVLQRAAGRLGARLRVVREPRPGKSVAIAAALAGCHTDVLALTDDDVQVGDDWVSSIRRVMGDPGVTLAGGPVLPLHAGPWPSWLDLREDDRGFGRLGAPLGLLHYGAERGPLGPRVLLGANMAVRREAFLAIGGFPAGLGKLRGTLLSGEDHEVCERIQAAGYVAVYDPSIRVRHLVPPERLRPGYFLRWFFWSGVTHAAMAGDTVRRSRHLSPSGRRVLGIPGFILRRLVTSSIGAVVSLASLSRADAVERATHAAFAAGYAWAALTRPALQQSTGAPVPERRAEAI